MTEVKLSEKLQKIATDLENLTTLEMAELAKYLEEKFGVSAMPVAAVAAPAAPQTQEASPQEEKSTFTVVLTDAGANKLAVIKAVREILPNLGLMDAKKLVESAPQELLKDVKKEAAEDAKKKIEAAGGKVDLK
ncbi:MAG: 50S ribosomal protein L7/L12 [Patescibacteria group bacterium]|nr:MAG: 50S ribosomal protein L7/L12 [Patescibacteria group bacterium]